MTGQLSLTVVHVADDALAVDGKLNRLAEFEIAKHFGEVSVFGVLVKGQMRRRAVNRVFELRDHAEFRASAFLGFVIGELSAANIERVQCTVLERRFLRLRPDQDQQLELIDVR